MLFVGTQCASTHNFFLIQEKVVGFPQARIIPVAKEGACGPISLGIATSDAFFDHRREKQQFDMNRVKIVVKKRLMFEVILMYCTNGQFSDLDQLYRCDKLDNEDQITRRLAKADIDVVDSKENFPRRVYLTFVQLTKPYQEVTVVQLMFSSLITRSQLNFYTRWPTGGYVTYNGMLDNFAFKPPGCSDVVVSLLFHNKQDKIVHERWVTTDNYENPNHFSFLMFSNGPSLFPLLMDHTPHMFPQLPAASSPPLSPQSQQSQSSNSVGPRKTQRKASMRSALPVSSLPVSSLPVSSLPSGALSVPSLSSVTSVTSVTSLTSAPWVRSLPSAPSLASAPPSLPPSLPPSQNRLLLLKRSGDRDMEDTKRMKGQGHGGQDKPLPPSQPSLPSPPSPPSLSMCGDCNTGPAATVRRLCFLCALSARHQSEKGDKDGVREAKSAIEQSEEEATRAHVAGREARSARKLRELEEQEQARQCEASIARAVAEAAVEEKAVQTRQHQASIAVRATVEDAALQAHDREAVIARTADEEARGQTHRRALQSSSSDSSCKRCKIIGHRCTNCSVMICLRCREDQGVIPTFQCVFNVVASRWRCNFKRRTTLTCNRCSGTGHGEHSCTSNVCLTCRTDPSAGKGCVFSRVQKWICYQQQQCRRCKQVGHSETTCLSSICLHCSEDVENVTVNPCAYVQPGRWNCHKLTRQRQCGRCGQAPHGVCTAMACSKGLIVPQDSDPPSHKCKFSSRSKKWNCRFTLFGQALMLTTGPMEGRVTVDTQGTSTQICTRCSDGEGCACRCRQICVGDLGDVRCPHCGAKKYPLEILDCCAKGTIVFPAIPKLPNSVLQMFPNNACSVPASVKLWREHSRSFNTAFAFASTVMKQATLSNRGPPVLVLTGQVTRLMWNGTETEVNRNRPAFAQIYYYSTEQTARIEARKGLVCLTEPLKDQKTVPFLTHLESVMADHPLSKDHSHNYLKHSHAPQGVVTLEETNRAAINDHGGAFDRYTADPIAGLVPNLSQQESVGYASRQVIPNDKKQYLRSVSVITGGVDALQYPLLHWHEDYKDAGWNAFMKKQPTENARRITCAEYYRYLLMVRDDPDWTKPQGGLVKDYLLHNNLLTQQMAIDFWVKVQDNRLEFLRKNQDKLRSTQYSTYVQAVETKTLETVGREIPSGTFLPQSVGGSDRDMRERFRDAMAMTRDIGQPSLFITMTANPNWPEVVLECKRWGENPAMRAEIVDRVFHLKLRELEKQLYVNGILGNCIAHIRVVEFQKRGLPHAHLGGSFSTFSCCPLRYSS